MVSQRLRGAARIQLAFTLVLGSLRGLSKPKMMPRWVLALVALPPLCFSTNFRRQAHDMKVLFKKLHKLDLIIGARVAAELAGKCDRESDPRYCDSPLQQSFGGLTMGSVDSGAHGATTKPFCSAVGRIKRDDTRRQVWFKGSRKCGLVRVPVGKEINAAEVARSAERL